MREIKLRNQFPENYDTNQASNEAGLDTGTQGGAKQEFKDECDINVILDRFGIGHEIPQGYRVPQYADLTGIEGDFHAAANAIAKANENFESLPATIRAKFQNDPGKFVAFATDEKNINELYELGLAKRPTPDPRTTPNDKAPPPPPPSGGQGPGGEAKPTDNK